VGDEVVLATAAGEPALALRVVGGGLTATWTSWPSDEWAPRWRDACAELAPLLRGLARTRGGAPRVEARIDGGELELDGVPGDWPLELDAVATELATGEVVGSARIALPPSSPGTDPRSLRRGSWSPESSFAAGTCELALAGANGWSSRLPFTLPTAEEFSSSPRRIASSPVAAATESGASVRAGHRAAPWLLGVSLAALAAGAALGALRQSFQAAGRSGR
jgi:hypothetical protein